MAKKRVKNLEKSLKKSYITFLFFALSTIFRLNTKSRSQIFERVTYPFLQNRFENTPEAIKTRFIRQKRTFKSHLTDLVWISVRVTRLIFLLILNAHVKRRFAE